MENVAIKYPDGLDTTSNNLFKITDQSLPSSEQIFDMLEQQLRDIVRITIINIIKNEFEQFIGAAPY